MDADITIIGAGVIGLAIAAACADERLNIYVLEKNDAHGRGISSRNSEVIHAGLYYPSESLKGSLCIEGRTMLYELCAQHALPHKKTGKLLIAATEHEMPKLEQLWSNARHNGVMSVSLLDQKQVMQMEPNIKAFGALYSPETGILNVHALMDYYLHAAKGKGVEIACRTEVKGIEPFSGGYKVLTVNGAGEYFEFSTERVVNAAGLHSDTIAKMIGKEYTLHYCKGNYFSINTELKNVVQRLIYPVPEEHHVGLGVHLTLDLTGRMKLGPDATYIDRYEDYRVDKERADLFYASAVKFLPFIKREEVIPDMSGIRPKLQGKGEVFRDFIISEDLPGFINLVGIESPGLTAAPAIARYVKKLIT